MSKRKVAAEKWRRQIMRHSLRRRLASADLPYKLDPATEDAIVRWAVDVRREAIRQGVQQERERVRRVHA